MNAPARFHVVTGSPDALPPLPVEVPAPRKLRRRKPGKLRAPRWPVPAALRPIPWGTPDPVLGAAVCNAIDTAMPATLWVYRPSPGPLLHWAWAAILVVLALATIWGFR